MIVCEWSEWTISNIEVAWLNRAVSPDVDPDEYGDIVVMQTDRLECGGGPIEWRNEPFSASSIEPPQTWLMTWTAAYGDDELVYRCEQHDLTIPGGGNLLRGDSHIVCLWPPRAPGLSFDGCCLESGTPTGSSGLPTTPCE